MTRTLVVSLIILTIFISSSKLCAFELDVDPDVITISTGPSSWDDKGGGSRFRMIISLSEVYLNVFIQKVEFGEENCCAKITKTYEIDSEKLEGKGNLFSVEKIEWIGYDSVRFKGDSTVYSLKNLDSSYKVIKKVIKNKKEKIQKNKTKTKAK